MSITAAVAPVAVKSATGVLTAAGVWSGVAVICVALIGAVVAYIKVMPRLRELENANNAGLRKEFIEEMAALRGEVKSAREETNASRLESEGMRDEVRALRTEVRKRDDKIDQLRTEIRELHGVIDGMRRENMAAQISGQRVIVDTLKSLPQGGGV
jgi:predicted nuclease with TOPRIM domain